MPAAIETRPQRPDCADVTRYLWARPQRWPISGFRRSAEGTARSLRARHGERPGSKRVRSSSSFRQPFSASLATRPWDRGNLRPTLCAVDGFPGSHATLAGPCARGNLRPTSCAVDGFPGSHGPTRHGERPGSKRVRSSLSFRQPFSASSATLAGPCDRGNLRPTLCAVDGFPGSHGPTEEMVSALGLMLSYRPTGGLVRSTFFFLPARGGPVSVSCPAAPIEAALGCAPGRATPAVPGKRAPTELASHRAA